MNDNTNNNLENIILQCENEDVNYNPPEKLTDNNGNNLYAYVTYVMLEEYHVGEAIVLAQSLINTGCNCDRVVLVTQDISQDAKKILALFYNKIIDINYVNLNNLVSNHIHNKYINLLITKFYAFNLTQYKKILLIAPNSVILKNPLHVFSLNTPAGILVDKNLSLEPDWYKDNCKNLNHGKLIDKKITDDLLNNFNNYGINGDYLLLKPEVGLFDDILLEINSGKYQELIEKFTYPDQQYLTIKYSGEWTHINPIFLGNNGVPNWKALFGTTVKVSVIDSFKDYYDIDIFILWTDIYRQVLNNFPELTYQKSLLNYNELTSKFIMHRKQQREKVGKKDIAYLDESYQEYYSKYNIKNTYTNQPIHKSQLGYYYLDRFNTYNSINPQVMFPDIEELDYITPIKKLSEYFGKDNYYLQILDFLSFTTKKPLYKYNYLEVYVRDLVMLEYTKCRESMYIMMLLPGIDHDLKNLEETIKYLETRGSVPYIKTISCNKNQFKNLLFWWHQDLNFNSRINNIKHIINNLNILEEHNPVSFIFFDDTQQLKLGLNPNIKKDIINECIKKLKIKKDIGILFNNYFYETIEFAEIVLNNNSLELLKYQNTDKLSSGFFSMSNLQYQTFRNSIYNNFSLLEIERIIVIDDVGLYSLGLRNFNNIDAVFIEINKDNSEYEKYMESIIYDNFSNKETKIKFINLAKQNTKYYNKNWKKNLEDLFDKINIKNLTELTTNPMYYYYFQGVKLINIPNIIHKMILSYHKSKLLDLLMLTINYSSYAKEFIKLDITKKVISFNNNNINLDDKIIKDIMKNNNYIKNDLKIIKF
jgi:glycogenin glucosyltransferase